MGAAGTDAAAVVISLAVEAGERGAAVIVKTPTAQPEVAAVAAMAAAAAAAVRADKIVRQGEERKDQELHMWPRKMKKIQKTAKCRV